MFGVGDVGARLMLVGEAPGKNEDLQGEPFVGAAGALLDELLAGIGISRDLVYIANVLKCRPPGNRDPRLDEIEACKGYLREQIRMIRPEVVVTLGNFATKLLLRTETGITRLRGQRFKWWMGATLVPTFHPAAALRGRPQVRADMEADFQTVKAILDETSDSMPPSPPTAGLGPAASAAVSPPVERGEYRAEPGEGGTFDDDEVDQLELFS